MRRSPLRAFASRACWLPFLCLLVSAQSQAALMPNEPDVVLAPLFVLLSAADAVIPDTSSCYGEYGQDGEPTVNDLLADEMAAVRDGRSAISSSCREGRCNVVLKRRGEHGGTAMSFEFAVTDGKLDVRTLQCRLRL